MSEATEQIGGMKGTGRRVAGPGYDLVEVVSGSGLKHLAVVHHERFRDHPVLGPGLQAVLSFMEAPDVSGVLPLVAQEHGAFVYPTGTVWTVAEVVRTLAGAGKGAGVKAGLELCYLVGEVLTEAHESAAPQGLSGHRSLSPWTVVLQGDGQPKVLGYGLPQVDLRAWRDDGRVTLREDAFRYAPPERLDGGAEDLSSDLFSLALVGLELMMGQPVYDGLLDDVRQQASRGEGLRRLYQWRERLPNDVREVLGRALKPDPDTRYRQGLDLVHDLHDLLGSIEVDGPSLVEVMARVRAAERRGRAIEPGKTGALSPEELAELAADLDDFQDAGLTPPRRPRPEPEPEPEPDEEAPRWKRVRTGRREATVSEGPGGPKELSARERLRQRLRGERDTQQERAAVPPAPTPAPEEPTSARDRLKRRLRQGSPGTSESASDDDARARLRRRLRSRERPSESASSPSPATEPPPPVPDPPPAEPGSAETEPTPDETVERLRSSGGAAAALLEQLRRTSPRSRRRVDRGADEVETPAAEPTAYSAPAPAEEPAVEPEPPAETPAVDEAPAAGLRVRVRSAGGELELELEPSAPVAASVRRVVDALGLVETDLAGQVTGWFRLEQGGRVLRGDEPSGRISAELPVDVGFVPNRSVRVDLRVQTDDGQVRFQAPVGTAVPARWLLAHLRRWLELPEGAWVMEVEGEVLHPDRVLAEVLPEAAPVVVVRR